MFHSTTFGRAAIAAATMLGLSFCLPAAAQDDPFAAAPRDYQAAWAHATALSGADVRYAPSHTAIHAPSENAVYLFTKWSHAAHPAYLRTEVLDPLGQPTLVVDLVAAGDAAAAEAWADQWEALLRTEIAPPPSPAEVVDAARSMIDNASAPDSGAGS